MNLISGILLVGTTLLYAASWIKSTQLTGSPSTTETKPSFSADRLMGAALGMHTLFLFVHSAMQHRCPTTHSFEAVIFLCWCIALVYFLVNFSFTVPWLAKYVTPAILVLFMIAFAGMLSMTPPEINATGWRMKLHTVSLLLAVALFLISCIAGVLYLIKEKSLKERKTSSRLPPLELLDKMNLWSLTFGFPLMTFGMFIGLILAYSNPELKNWVHDKKVIFSSIAWLTYAATLHLRIASSYRGRRVILLTLVGFGFMLLALLGTRWHYFGP